MKEKRTAPIHIYVTDEQKRELKDFAENHEHSNLAVFCRKAVLDNLNFLKKQRTEDEDD